MDSKLRHQLQAVAFAILIPGRGYSQAVVQLPAAQAVCARCTVTLERVATLGSAVNGDLKRKPLTMARDSRGRFYVTYGQRPELASVFDSTGRFLQEIGRKGMGPGEFRYALAVAVDAQDRVLIYDFDGSRESLLSADYQFLRQNVQRAATLAVTHDGQRLTNFSALDARNLPAPVSVLDANGAFVRAFGATNRGYVDGDPWRINRMVSIGAANSLWLARTDIYRVERWSLEGQLLQAFERPPSWFPPIARRGVIAFCERPTPEVRAVRDDAGGRVWLIVSIASEKWETAMGPRTTQAGRPTRCRTPDHGALYDTMIEVVDLSTGRLMVSQRVPGLIEFLLGNDLAAGYRQDTDGNPFVDIWRLRFQNPR